MDRKLLYILLPLRPVIFLLFFMAGSLITNKELSEISHWWSVADTPINILTIILLTAVAGKNGMTYRELINYQKGKTKVSRIILVSLVILTVGTGGMYLAGFLCYGVIPYLPQMMIAPIHPVLAIINIPLLPVTTALAEDGLYLGCGVNHIRNKYAAVLVPAFFFALQHSFIPPLPDLRYMIYRFLSFLPITVILCGYYYKKRDPVPIMIGHALIDVATVMEIFATSAIPGVYEGMLGS